MRPPNADIAAPELPPWVTWVNAAPLRMEQLAGGAVLIHFWDFAQLNSLRALPYVRLWHERYGEAGLRAIGVHSPRYPFSREPEAVRRAVARLEVAHPVAIDSELAVWHAYGNTGWPALFLWGPGGVLRYYHFGEGEYLATEEAIQELLAEIDPRAELPEPLAPLRPTDAPGARVLRPSAELFPGGSVERPWTATEAERRLEVDYEAGGAHATVEGAGRIAIELDGEAAGEVAVAEPGLYELAAHEAHEAHRLALEPTPGQGIYSIAFAAGVPG